MSTEKALLSYLLDLAYDVINRYVEGDYAKG